MEARASTTPEHSPRGPRLHATLFAVLMVCTAAFVVELNRATRGNSLSWAYVFEWPLLGAFAIYMWWRLRHPDAPARSRPIASSPQVERMRVAWQEAEKVRALHDAPSEELGDAS